MFRVYLTALAFLLGACANDAGAPPTLEQKLVKSEDSVRIALFNVSLYRNAEGELVSDFLKGDDPQIAAVAEIIKRVDPDIIVLNEVDYDENFRPLGILRDNYLTAPAVDGIKPLSYPYIYMAPSNTGLNLGTVDFDNNGEIVTEVGSNEYAGDSFGYGRFVGQYGMAVMSKYPLIRDMRRSFKQFKWADMPDNLLPVDYYSEAAQEAFRLSSKNHLDLVVRIDGQYLHLLMMHPTPPTFDGPEDRNGRRNHDEIRFFADYVSPEASSYIIDDAGVAGGLETGERFVVIGDLNADRNDGDSRPGAIQQLLDHPLIVDPKPASEGGWAAAAYQGGANDTQTGDHRLDTADFRDKGQGAVGNLRLDYVLPSRSGLEVTGAGVFWPEKDEPGYELVGPGYPVVSSDHRLVWVDVRLTD